MSERISRCDSSRVDSAWRALAYSPACASADAALMQIDQVRRAQLRAAQAVVQQHGRHRASLYANLLEAPRRIIKNYDRPRPGLICPPTNYGEMMLTAKRNLSLRVVLARDSERVEAPFTCPGCEKEVVLHKGQIVVHHFKHKPPVTWSRGQGESLDHMRAKLAIYDALLTEANVDEVELEKDFGISVADVYANISGVAVAIEIQRVREHNLDMN